MLSPTFSSTFSILRPTYAVPHRLHKATFLAISILTATNSEPALSVQTSQTCPSDYKSMIRIGMSIEPSVYSYFLAAYY